MEDQSKTSSAEISKKAWQTPVIEMISHDNVLAGTVLGVEGEIGTTGTKFFS